MDDDDDSVRGGRIGDRRNEGNPILTGCKVPQ
jgi:hypothetical protein